MKRRIAKTTIACIAFVFCAWIHLLSSPISRSSAPKPLELTEKVSQLRSKAKSSPPEGLPSIRCDRSQYRYDLCLLNGPTIIHPANSTLLVVGPPTPPQIIRPLPRKWEPHIMAEVNALTLSSTTAGGGCQVMHQSPALVFSTGGYTGNFYHDFTDGFVPLFVTTRSLRNMDPVLVITNAHNWWLSRYDELLRGITRHPIINLDNETAVHCFPSASVGLIAHGDMAIDSSLMPNSESFKDFHALVLQAYEDKGLGLPQAPVSPARPRLVLLARVGDVGRVILNQADVVRVAEEVGFHVDVLTPTPTTMLREAYRVINAGHALFGVHGAAFTHLFFLRPGAVVIQVVALGLDWASETCFGKACREMGVEYMEYKIEVEESSLVEKYKRDDVVLSNPRSVVKKGWNYTNLYLKEQNVRLDLVRISSYLKAAYDKAKKLSEGRNRVTNT